MSTTSTFFGRFLIGSLEDAKFNLDYIDQLPSAEFSFPIITKEMFNRNLALGDGELSIGFSRSYKNTSYEEWIAAFEKHIVNLKWWDIRVIVETEFEGTKQYKWVSKEFPSSERLVKDGFIEESDWYFGKGHKEYESIFGLSDLGNETEEIIVLKYLVEGLSKSILEHSSISLIETKIKNELALKSPPSGIKKLIIELLQVYIKNYESKVAKGLEEGFESLGDGDINIEFDNLFNKSSDYRISNVILENEVSDKNWIYRFMEFVRRLKSN